MKFQLLILLVLWCTGTIGQNPITWTPLSTIPEPIANNAVSQGTYLGVPHVYSFSGIDTTKDHVGISLKSFRYNTQTMVWDTIPPLPDTLGKIAAGASTVNNIIYVMGGYHVLSDGMEISSDKVHRYDPATNSYLPDGAPIPKPIDDQVQCVWRDSLIFLITGWSNTGNVRDVQIYDPSSDSWQIGTSVPTTASQYACFGGSGTIIGDTIFYYGGAKSGLNFPASDVLRKGVIAPTDPTNITWDLVAAGPRRAYRSACFHYQDRAFWLGGSSISYNYDGLAYFDGSGVPPANSVISYQSSTGNFTEWNYSDSVMDLRGIARISPNQWIVCGGMIESQQVTDKSWLIEFDTTYVGLREHLLEFRMYPNPVSEILFVEGLPDYLQVYNLAGSILLTSYSNEIDIRKLAAGVYIVKAFKGGSATSKLIVKQ